MLTLYDKFDLIPVGTLFVCNLPTIRDVYLKINTKQFKVVYSYSTKDHGSPDYLGLTFDADQFRPNIKFLAVPA